MGLIGTHPILRKVNGINNRVRPYYFSLKTLSLCNLRKQGNIMRYENLLGIVLVVSLFGSTSIGKSADKSDSLQMPLSYYLIVEKKIDSQTKEIACRLRVENRTDKLQFVSRPEEKDISLSMNGLDTQYYSVNFEKRGFESLAKREIPLRPTCSIEMELCRILPSGFKQGDAVIPTGNYIVSASWKRPSLPDVKPSQLEVITGYQAPATDVQPKQDEYLLGITLEPSAKKFYPDDPIMLSVRIQNNGSMPITLMNYFDRHKDFFRFQKKDAVSGKMIQETTPMAAAITPHAREGWLTLLPRECVSVAIDASDEFKSPGEYRVTVTYFGSSILLRPLVGKPYYTKQHTWTSKEIKIVISNVSRPGTHKED